MLSLYFRTGGDAFSAAFSTAPAAVNAAAEIQRRLHAEPWQLERPLQVRAVLHSGSAEVVPNEQREYDGFLENLNIWMAELGGSQADFTAVREQGRSRSFDAVLALYGARVEQPDERLDKPGQQGT